jgi:hypothetical protein
MSSKFLSENLRKKTIKIILSVKINSVQLLWGFISFYFEGLNTKLVKYAKIWE